MAERFKNSSPQYLDDNGNPYVGGKLYFCDPGTDRNNLKNTYSNKALTTANANPLILDSQGRIPIDIWGSGSYMVILDDANDAQVFVDDPVDFDTTANPAYADYDATVTYSLDDRVKATNGKFYKSLINTNLNNEPSVSASSWTEIVDLEVYNANVTYALGDVVVDSVGRLWRSLVGSNTGNTPGADDTNWTNVTANKFEAVKTASFTMVAGFKYTVTASTAVDAALPGSISAGDPFVLHNNSTSTATVRITNTHTIQGVGGSLTTGNHLIVPAGQTAELAAISSSVLEVV